MNPYLVSKEGYAIKNTQSFQAIDIRRQGGSQRRGGVPSEAQDHSEPPQAQGVRCYEQQPKSQYPDGINARQHVLPAKLVREETSGQEANEVEAAHKTKGGGGCSPGETLALSIGNEMHHHHGRDESTRPVRTGELPDGEGPERRAPMLCFQRAPDGLSERRRIAIRRGFCVAIGQKSHVLGIVP